MKPGRILWGYFAFFSCLLLNQHINQTCLIWEWIELRFYHKSAAVLAGSLLIAAGTHLFLVPNKILDGGIIGIALIVNYLFGTNIGFVMVLCSIPLFALAWFYERNFFYSSLYGLLISSLVMDLSAPLHQRIVGYIGLTPISCSILGGFVVGTGIGIMLKVETSTGGTDLLGQFIAKAIVVNVGIIIFLLDGLIICLGGLLISEETFFLSMITIAAGGAATTLCTMRK